MTPQSISYAANGNCTTFAFAFPVFEPMELEVLIDGTLQTSGFVTHGDGANSGGAVVFAAAPVSGKTITLRRAGKVQVSDSDAPGFLADKIVAGNNVTVTQTSDANGQHLTIAAAANPADFLLKSQNLADLPNAATARSNLGLGTTATRDVGTSANQVVQLDANAKLPALDGSQLTNIPVGKVQTDGTDSAGYLQDKLAAGANIAVTKVADKMTVAVTGLGTAAALNIDTDGSLAADSDTRIASEKAVKTYVDSQIAAIPPLPPYRNLLIGGDAGTNPWQRGTNISISGSDPRAYTADRWVCWGPGVGVSLTVSRQAANITGFPFCFRLQRTAGNTVTGGAGMFQVVESVNVIPYRGKTLTLSFQARCGANFSAAANALSVTIATGTGTDEGSNAFISGTWSGPAGITETRTLTTGFQTFTASFTLPADASELAVTFSYVPTGTAGAADYMEIACIELDAYGATSFEVLPEDVVLARCLRYHFRTNSGTGTYGGIRIEGYASGPRQGIVQILSFPVRMMRNPTAVIQNAGGWGTLNCDAPSVSGVSQTTAVIRCASLDAGICAASPASNDDIFIADAEL